MNYNAIIFTDISDHFIPLKASGAYNIATHLRNNGYFVKVIDNQSWLWGNHGKELMDYVLSLICTETIFIGFSSTFSRYLTNYSAGRDAGNGPSRNTRYLELTKEDYFPYMKELIARIHLMHSHVKLVLGGQGLQTYAFYDHFGEEFDCWIKGLGEDSILKFVRNVEQGIENPPIMDDIESPIFDFHNQKNIFDVQDNILQYEVFPLEISRGCRFKCKFCAFPLLGRKPSDDYIRSEESIYSELMYNYENFSTSSYMLTDDTFNETTDKVKRVLRAVERTGVSMNFWAYIRVELLYKFPEQIELLGQIGLKVCFFGLESLYDPSAKAIGKGLGRDKTLDTLQRAKDTWAWGDAANLHGSFIIGLPHETRETADEWTELLIKGHTALDTISCGGLTLTPDSVIKSGHTSKAFFSDFELNKSMYGYEEIADGGWKNKYWTNKDAHAYAKDVINRFIEARPYFTWGKAASPSGIEAMNLKVTNPELTWEDIHEPLKNEEEAQNFQMMLTTSRNTMLNRYKEMLFNG